ncbi:hypothetical protein [Salinimicrobium gaetbulicola]|uniref:DKNYY family protein n=1 Tax=Salinimicrobium gaetbulicola TaxID=999702 RepID=A0ABW3IC40_9FLAO
MKILQIILIFLIFLSLKVNGQEKIIFHEFSPTASSWNILKWNIKNQNEKRWVVKETVDSIGRVIKLEFLKDGEIIPDPLCYLASKVTFEYKQNQVIERLYHDNNEILATECENWFKSIYHLNSQNKIEKIERFSKYDFTNIDSTKIEKWKTDWAPEYIIETPDSSMLQIEYYYHSFAKMGGIYPVSENYILDEESYYFGDEPEKSSIKNGLKN